MSQSQQLISTVTEDGRLELCLRDIEIPTPAENEVVLRVEATPVNPSDLGTLTAGADLAAATNEGTGGARTLSAPIAPAVLKNLKARWNQPLPVGNEGAGIVIDAGSSAAAQALLGKTVAVLGGAMYAHYRCVAADTCLVMPSGITPRDAASCFVNPLTVLGMIETMRLEGHSAIVHTAAASNLGQMLNKACQADRIGLVNIVRSGAQRELLQSIGAQFVCDSSSDDFADQLVEAIDATHATIAFDAVGGGLLADQILNAMERVAEKNPSPANRYGSTIHKQVYLYGVLDTQATILNRTYGMAWGVGGWLLPNFLTRVGAGKAQALRERVASEIKTTFASHYTQVITLEEALDVDIAQKYQRKSTGEKFLIAPHRDA